MALAIDTSTPVFTAVPKTSTSRATATFSPPAGSVLVLAAMIDGPDTSSQSVTSVTDSLSSHLNWTSMVRSNTFTAAGSTLGGSAEFWYAYTPAAQTSMTVTATFTQSVAGGGTNAGGMQLIVFTGASPIQNGTTATKANSAAGAAPTQSLFVSSVNSWVFGCVVNYTSGTLPTVGTAQTVSTNSQNAQLGDNTTGAAWWCQHQNATTAGPGTSVTINDTAPLIQYNMALVEILAQIGYSNDYQFVKAGNGMSVTEKIK